MQTTREFPWLYQTASGIQVIGQFEKSFDYGGTDIVYFMRRNTGELDVLSGSRLKAAQRIYPTGATV